MNSRFLIALFVGAACLAFSAAAARATEMAYIFTGTASGWVDSTQFTDASFTITGVGDLTNLEVIGGAIYVLNLDSATIELNGFPMATFITATRVFSNTNTEAVGFARQVGSDIFNIRDPILANYDLTTLIGPAFDPEPDGAGHTLSTTIGELNMHSYSNGSFTAVPEPAAGGAVLGAAILLRRRARS